MKYDLARLEAVAERDKDFIVKVLKVFIVEVSTDIQKMQDAFKADEMLEISKLAHKIKPNLILLGLDQATSLCIRIEKNRLTPMPVATLIKQLNDLQASVAEVVEVLKSDFSLV